MLWPVVGETAMSAAGVLGSVSQQRYEAIVAEVREVVAQQSKGQFRIGDCALEVEPIRSRGGDTGDAQFTVRQSLMGLAEDIGVPFSTVKHARWTASRWPKEYREPVVSWTVHRILGGIEDGQERLAAIRTPPAGRGR
ncbi:hypothetical protein GCM10018772_23640 [Streptomyces fumanus]|uniref:Uncharacterized protein n=1 Tax=Streptomyces fumanus TaxID=67302 RepID=A0A919ABM0_9ACTN|nr:hypothetical protein GCM10018772_23640 [Streptomyces fumanus]